MPPSLMPGTGHFLKYLFIFNLFYCLGSSLQHVGRNPGPLHWKCEGLATGPPGKPQTNGQLGKNEHFWQNSLCSSQTPQKIAVSTCPCQRMGSLDPTLAGPSQGTPASPAVSSKVPWWEWEAGLHPPFPTRGYQNAESVPECTRVQRVYQRVPGCREHTRVQRV